MADVQGDDHFADGGRKIGDDDNRISLARVGNGDGRIVIKAEREREQARRELEPVGDSILIGLYQESEIDGSATDKERRGTDPETGGVGAGGGDGQIGVMSGAGDQDDALVGGGERGFNVSCAERTDIGQDEEEIVALIGIDQ